MGAPHVMIFSDHSALTSLSEKELVKIENIRLVTMLEKLGNFNYKIRHLARAAADYLSSKITKLTRGCITVEGRRSNHQLSKHCKNNKGN